MSNVSGDGSFDLKAPFVVAPRGALLELAGERGGAVVGPGGERPGKHAQ